MNTNRTPTGRGVKSIGVACAAVAVAVAGALTVSLDHDGQGHASTLAGSGDAPTNTVFIQPTVAAMTMGATATEDSTPASVPATTEAVPAIKAGS
jgi:hypothetical protein